MADEEDIGLDDGASIGEDIQELEQVEAEEQDDSTREIAKESRALQFLNTHHPEARIDYREDVLKKLQVDVFPPDHNRDWKHKSVPYLTVFEKTKIIGFRADQLAKGCKPFINPVPAHVTDVLEIAALELEQKRLPFILKRPMPDGTFEYIRLRDLLII
jgi:DNA-directed RNA polymerase I, II, and III subunit RPABC2